MRLLAGTMIIRPGFPIAQPHRRYLGRTTRILIQDEFFADLVSATVGLSPEMVHHGGPSPLASD